MSARKGLTKKAPAQIEPVAQESDTITINLNHKNITEIITALESDISECRAKRDALNKTIYAAEEQLRAFAIVAATLKNSARRGAHS